MYVPRTTVIRKLAQLKRWGLIDREGKRYYLREKVFNSLIGMENYQQVRRILEQGDCGIDHFGHFAGLT